MNELIRRRNHTFVTYVGKDLFKDPNSLDIYEFILEKGHIFAMYAEKALVRMTG